MKQIDYYHKFVKEADIEEAKKYSIWKLHKKAIETPEKLTEEDKSIIFAEIQSSGYGSGGVRIMGIYLDFSPILKTYWVKQKYLGISEIRAPSKMNIRKGRSNQGIIRIEKIKDKLKKEARAWS